MEEENNVAKAKANVSEIEDNLPLVRIDDIFTRQGFKMEEEVLEKGSQQE